MHGINIKHSTASFILMAIFSASIIFNLSGCANGPQISPEMGAALVRANVGVGLTLVLNKNPKYVPAATAIAAGIDVAIAGTSTLTIQGIDAYVMDICSKNGVSSEDAALFTGLANTIYTVYISQYKPTVILSSDPKVLLYVTAFKDGVGDAVMVHNSAVKK